MKPSEEEHSSVSSSSEFLICEDPEPERLAKLSQQAKSSSPSVAILNSREHSSNLSSTITKRVQPESSLASNLVFKSKSQHSSSSSHDIRQAKKSIIPTDGIKSDSSGSKLSSPSITRIEESLTASKRSLNLCNQSLAENLPPKINTTSIPTNVKAEKRGTNSIHVETDSSIEIGKSSVSRFIDRQSSKGSRSPSSSPKTRIRSVYVKSDTLSTSSNSSSDESVDVPYHTLTRLNSCPACSDEWNTYKAPRSKLTHIKKCARTNLIRPKDIINRIQAILDKQIQNDPDPSSLLDLHIQNKNVQVNILEGDPQVQTSLKPDLLCRPPQQSRSHPPNSSISGDVQRSNGDTEKVNPQCTSSVSKSGDNLLTSSPPDLIHRSSLLAQARSRSCTRNSLIPNDGKTPYNLWNAAGGHDGFDFQRSCKEENERLKETVANVNKISRVEATPFEPKAQNSQEEAFSDQLSDQNLDSSKNRIDDCNLDRIPSFEDWTRKELENENERLGFEDASEASSLILIQRAKDAWRETLIEVLKLQDRHHHLSIEDESSFDEGGGSDERVLDEGLDIDQRQLGSYREASRFDGQGLSSPRSSQKDTRATCRVTASNSYISGAEGGYASDETHISRPATDGDDDDNDSVCGGELEWIPSKPVMPDYSSYSKSALEVEYFSLYALQQDQKPRSEIPSPPPALPKTKPAILARVIILWRRIYIPELTVEGSSQVSNLKKQKKSVVPKKKKLTSEEIDELLSRVCLEDESFYMRILRYEPFKLSVFESKVADAVRIENAKPISSLILSKWLDWQAISYFTLDPTVSRKRH